MLSRANASDDKVKNSRDGFFCFDTDGKWSDDDGTDVD